MKKLFTLFGIAMCILFISSSSTNAQISIAVTGYTNTTPNLASSYTSLANAISAINAITAMSGPVVFNLAAGGTETAVNQVITTTYTTATNTLTFQKSGAGANPLITAGVGTGTYDGVIEIQGTDYVTFDGIDVQESSGNTTTTTQMEWGYGIFVTSATNASQYITIKNCTITLNKTNTGSNGIYTRNYSATGTSYTPTSTAGVVSYCKFYNNTISNVYTGIYLYANTTITYYGMNNEVGNA
jgi:trimeric autotransporter adhesin